MCPRRRKRPLLSCTVATPMLKKVDRNHYLLATCTTLGSDELTSKVGQLVVSSQNSALIYKAEAEEEEVFFCC